MLSDILILILYYRYHKKIDEHLREFSRSKAGLTFGIFLMAISFAFIAETSNFLVIIASASLTIIALLFYLS